MSKNEINSLMVTLIKVILVVLAIQVGAKAQDFKDFDNVVLTVGNGKCHVEFLDGSIEELKEFAPNTTLKKVADYLCDDFGYEPSEVYVSFESSGITIKDPQNNSKKYVIDDEHKFENEYYRKSFDSKISRAEFVKGIWSDYNFKEVKDY